MSECVHRGVTMSTWTVKPYWFGSVSLDKSKFEVHSRGHPIQPLPQSSVKIKFRWGFARLCLKLGLGKTYELEIHPCLWATSTWLFQFLMVRFLPYAKLGNLLLCFMTCAFCLPNVNLRKELEPFVFVVFSSALKERTQGLEAKKMLKSSVAMIYSSKGGAASSPVLSMVKQILGDCQSSSDAGDMAAFRRYCVVSKYWRLLLFVCMVSILFLCQV